MAKEKQKPPATDLLMKYANDKTGSKVDFSRVYKERRALSVRVPLVKEILRSAGYRSVADGIPEYDSRRTEGEWCHFAHRLQEEYGGGEGGGDLLEGGQDGGDGGRLVRGGNGGGDPRGGQQGSMGEAGGGNGSIQVGGGNGSIQAGGGNGSGGQQGSMDEAGNGVHEGGGGGARRLSCGVKRPLESSDEAPPRDLLHLAIAPLHSQLQLVQRLLIKTQAESPDERAIYWLKESIPTFLSFLESLQQVREAGPLRKCAREEAPDHQTDSSVSSSESIKRALLSADMLALDLEGLKAVAPAFPLSKRSAQPEEPPLDGVGEEECDSDGLGFCPPPRPLEPSELSEEPPLGGVGEEEYDTDGLGQCPLPAAPEPSALSGEAWPFDGAGEEECGTDGLGFCTLPLAEPTPAQITCILDELLSTHGSGQEESVTDGPVLRLLPPAEPTAPKIALWSLEELLDEDEIDRLFCLNSQM